MPRVPEYEPIASPRGFGTPSMGPTASVTDAGIAVTRSLQRTAAMLGAIKMQQIEEQDLAVVQAAQTEMGDTWYAMVADPQSGARAKLGAEAIGITAPTLAAWDREMERIRGRLTTDRQRRAFDRISQGRRMEVANQLSAHEAAETKRSIAQGVENAVAQALRDAAVDPETLSRARVDLARSIGAAAGPLGWDNETTQRRYAEAVSSVIVAAADARKDDDPVWARGFLEEHKGEILPEHGRELKNLVKISSMRQRAETAAREAFEKTHDLGDGMQYLDDHYSGMTVEEMDEARRRLRSYLVDEEADRSADAKEANRLAQEQFVRGGFRTSAVDPELRDRLIEIAPDRWSALVDTEDRKADEAYNEMRTRWTPAGHEAWGKFLLLPPEQRAQIDPYAQYLGLIPDAALPRMAALVEAAQAKVEGKKEKAAERNMIPLDKAIGKIKAEARAGGMWAPSTTHPKAKALEQKRLGAYTDAVLAEVDPLADEFGRLPSDKLQEAIDRLKIKGQVDHSIFGLVYDTQELYWFEATPEQRREGRWPEYAGAMGRQRAAMQSAHQEAINQVPDWFRTRAEDYLRSTGQNANDPNRIAAMYRQHLAQQQAK